MSQPLRITGERVGPVAKAAAPSAPIWQHPCTGECNVVIRPVHSVGGYQAECRAQGCRHYGPLALYAFGRTEGETMELAREKFADELTRYQGEGR
jgi:hypothetical protein